MRSRHNTLTSNIHPAQSNDLRCIAQPCASAADADHGGALLQFVHPRRAPHSAESAQRSLTLCRRCSFRRLMAAYLRYLEGRHAPRRKEQATRSPLMFQGPFVAGMSVHIAARAALALLTESFGLPLQW